MTLLPDQSREIRCPHCCWRPDGKPWWTCSCGCVWNTFETAGRCPVCGVAWEFTQCPGPPGGCGRWSPHLDWYEGLGDWLGASLEALGISAPVQENLVDLPYATHHFRLRRCAGGQRGAG